MLNGLIVAATTIGGGALGLGGGWFAAMAFADMELGSLEAFMYPIAGAFVGVVGGAFVGGLLV